MAAPEKAAAPADTPARPPPKAADTWSVVDTPTSPSSAFALSRFEFEAGKGNEGTKILMVEWDASARDLGAEQAEAPPKTGPGVANGDVQDWEISWEGKTDVLPVPDVEVGNSSNSDDLRRVYFLLPPGAVIPTSISITRRKPAGGSKGVPLQQLHTKPMPAIFPAELTGGREAGRLGVLHTLWAKRRLAELQAEIAAEMRTNGESVGLEMALRDRQWIVDHFGLGPAEGVPRATRLHIPGDAGLGPGAGGPTSPRSPVGGRLGEKLRGLKLATSPAELAAASQVANSAQPKKPTDAIPRTTPAGDRGLASLDAMVGGSALSMARDDNTEEDLFALPMSPRSPEMKRSPFSLL